MDFVIFNLTSTVVYVDWSLEVFQKEGDVAPIVAIVGALIVIVILAAIFDLLLHDRPQRSSVAIVVYTNWFFAVYNAALLFVLHEKLSALALGAGVFVVAFFALVGYCVKKKYQKSA